VAFIWTITKKCHSSISYNVNAGFYRKELSLISLMKNGVVANVTIRSTGRCDIKVITTTDILLSDSAVILI
jgi:hypothetical protein